MLLKSTPSCGIFPQETHSARVQVSNKIHSSDWHQGAMLTQAQWIPLLKNSMFMANLLMCPVLTFSIDFYFEKSQLANQ